MVLNLLYCHSLFVSGPNQLSFTVPRIPTFPSLTRTELELVQLQLLWCLYLINVSVLVSVQIRVAEMIRFNSMQGWRLVLLLPPYHHSSFSYDVPSLRGNCLINKIHTHIHPPPTYLYTYIRGEVGLV